MEISKQNFLKLPEVPAVYTFWKKNSTSGTDIPIYIGKSVNLKSRLNSYLDLNLSPKTAQMMSEASHVTYIEVTSDLESLLLEADQVHKLKPKYNILLKDDKHALYIVITKEEFPRIITSRKSGNYGPFPNATNVKSILRLVRKVFPYSDHKIGKKPCIYSAMNLCVPCPNEIVHSTEYVVLSKKYKQNIHNIKLVLSRKFNVVRKSLEKDMNSLSKQQKYEEAKVIRERIKILDYITQKRIDTQEFLQNPNLVEDVRALEIENLKAKLNENCKRSLPLGGKLKIENLHRIECYDVAHLSGASPTASMVVAIDGEMENSEYKHFKIKQKNKQSDYDSMREVVKRRLKHLNSWGKPDLVLVDGGLGQVKIANEVFKGSDILVVGIAKHPDRLVFPDGTKIKLQGLSLQFLSRIRDEAHRFARRLHHKLISKALLTRSA